MAKLTFMRRSEIRTSQSRVVPKTEKKGDVVAFQVAGAEVYDLMIGLSSQGLKV